MAAASYYNGNTQEPRPQIAVQTTYGNGPHNLPSTQPHSQPQPYRGGSTYNKPNENPATHPIAPLLDKPTTTHAPAAAGAAPSGPQKLHMVDPSLNRIRRRKFQKWKQYLRIGQLLTKTITIIFTAIMFAIMIFITVKYQTTKDTFRGGRTAWPKNPKLWPTFMLLAASGFTLAVSIVTLLGNCFGSSKNGGNRSWVGRSWKLTVLKYVIHIAAWFVVSVIYRYEKSLHGVNNDLWGWTCSEEVAVLQSEFKGVVDFSVLCDSQSSSWGVSLTEFLVKIAFAIGHFVIYRKTKDDEKVHLADGLGGAITDGVEDVF